MLSPVEEEVELASLVVGVGGAPVSEAPKVASPDPELVDVLAPGSGGIGMQEVRAMARSALVLGFTLVRYSGQRTAPEAQQALIPAYTTTFALAVSNYLTR